jgi:hypothetical protein
MVTGTEVLSVFVVSLSFNRLITSYVFAKAKKCFFARLLKYHKRQYAVHVHCTFSASRGNLTRGQTHQVSYAICMLPSFYC